MTKPRLKPCPFCGKPGYLFGDNSNPYQVACDSTGCEMNVKTPLCLTAREAVAIWNRRAGQAKGGGK